ncbi:MAG: hypothetical protein PHX68_03895 [Alphaproteobacteria bacterium]|nr:hypothetical protein [Alphaproteobacteria bacterium]
MAQVDALRQQLADIKKDVSQAKDQMARVHAELLNFMGSVQSKTACQTIQDRMKADYALRAEIAPMKAILGVIVLTTTTAICMAIADLIFK